MNGQVHTSVQGIAPVRKATVPNCLYVGTSKAGSTWIFDLLVRHPQVYAAPGKGIYFFDTQYDRGVDWYLSHFEGAREEPAVVEISHSYLYSETACRRIAELDPEMKILACLREPADRAFSDYLDHLKNGKFSGTFEEAIDQVPQIVQRGRYATYLKPYLETFGRSQIHLAVFDELGGAPQLFADRLFEFLEVSPLALDESQTKKIMPAGRPRSRTISWWTKQVSKRLKRIGLRPLMGRIKRSRAVRDLLYKPYADKEKPRPSAESVQKLREIFAPEVSSLDQMFGTQLYRQWRYDQ